MGNKLSSLFRNLFKNKQSSILMCGLDGVGKTTILYALKLKSKSESVPPTVPTIGFNVETISYNKVNFTIRDVGGQERMRPSWRNYYMNVNAVIFVVDSADLDRLQEATEELQKLINDEQLINRQHLQNGSGGNGGSGIGNGGGTGGGSGGNSCSGDVVLLVFANKQDLDGAIGVQQMTEQLGLYEVKHVNWYVQPCAAVTGEGLYEGLEWLSRNI